MKKWLGFFGALLFSGVAIAQTTIVVGVATDSDSTLWANGTVSVQFVPNPSQPNLNVYRINGAPLSSAVTMQGPISLGSGGSFSVTVYDNTQVTPSGSQWQFTICPQATSKCGSVTTPVSGSGQSITTLIDAAIPAPRFPATAGSYGYTDVEAILTYPVGGTYWNVGSLCQRYYNGSSWGCGTVLGLPISIASGGTGATTAAGALANLGGAALSGATFTGPVSAPSLTLGTPLTVTNGGTGVTTAAWTDPRTYGAQCNGTIDDTTAMQNAINAVPSGGTLYFPQSGLCLISSTLTIANAITMEGVGWNSGLLVASTMPTNQDVLHVYNATNPISGFTARDFAILPQSEIPAQNAITFDAQAGTNTISNFEIDHLEIGQFHAQAIAMYGPNPSLAFDGVFTGSVHDSVLTGGANLQNAGDSLHFQNNTITGTGIFIVNLIGLGSNTAHGFLFDGNNVTVSGGVQVINAWSGQFTNNNMELYSGATGSDGAVLDLAGNATIPPTNIVIQGNTILSGPSVSTCIRVNQVVGTFIGPNRLTVATGGDYTVTVTSLADRTMLFLPWTEPNGELPGSWLSDPGNVGTTLVYLDPTTKKWTFNQLVNFNNGISINGYSALLTTQQTGTGSIVMSGSPTINTPTLNTPTIVGGATGAGSIVLANSPTLVTPTLGNASSTSETIGGGLTISNSSLIVQVYGSVTTTGSETSDTLSDARLTASSHCWAMATNPSAAAFTGVYTATGTGVMSVIHSAGSAGASWAISCSKN